MTNETNLTKIIDTALEKDEKNRAEYQYKLENNIKILITKLQRSVDIKPIHNDLALLLRYCQKSTDIISGTIEASEKLSYIQKALSNVLTQLSKPKNSIQKHQLLELRADTINSIFEELFPLIHDKYMEYIYGIFQVDIGCGSISSDSNQLTANNVQKLINYLEQLRTEYINEEATNRVLNTCIAQLNTLLLPTATKLLEDLFKDKEIQECLEMQKKHDAKKQKCIEIKEEEQDKQVWIPPVIVVENYFDTPSTKNSWAKS